MTEIQFILIRLNKAQIELERATNDLRANAMARLIDEIAHLKLKLASHSANQQ